MRSFLYLEMILIWNIIVFGRVGSLGKARYELAHLDLEVPSLP